MSKQLHARLAIRTGNTEKKRQTLSKFLLALPQALFKLRFALRVLHTPVLL
jgi:hypothetical protein